MSAVEELHVVGAEQPRRDGRAKVTGAALYTADISVPGMLHAKVLRSPHAHARIVSIDASAARALPGVGSVVVRDDLGETYPWFGYLIKDRPIVAVDRVRYIGDIVAGVAAVDEETALRALELIEVEYEVLPAVASIEESLAPDAVEVFPEAPRARIPGYGTGVSTALRPRHNVTFRFSHEAGEADPAWAACDQVFDDTFAFSRMNHFHLEPFVTVVSADEEQMEVWTSTAAPFQIRTQLSQLFGLAEQQVRIHTLNVGGAFGAKGNIRIEPLAVLLSRQAGRPVRMALTLEESFLTQSQHAAVLRLRTGVRNDGTLVARRAEVLLDAGAYSDASPLVAEKAGYRCGGPYRWEHFSSQCECVVTNTTPAGAFRGFGAPQAVWASESQIDMIAHRLGMDPYELRSKNMRSLGEPYTIGESGLDSDVQLGLDTVVDAIGYRDRVRRPGRGMGLAIGLKDGGGSAKLGMARLRVSRDGVVQILSGTVEAGQGAHTALCQIAAEVLGTSLDQVSVVPIDTAITPYDKGTNSLSGVVVMGNAVVHAASQIKRQVLEFAASERGLELEKLDLRDWQVVSPGDEPIPVQQLLDDYFGEIEFSFEATGHFRTGRDREAPFGAPSLFWEIGWAAVEVEVDVETGVVDILQLIVVGDPGRAIHPRASEGQDQGGAVMGLGQTMFEEMRYDGAHLLNGETLDYRVPMAGDLPAIFRTITLAQGHGPGPFGAKGVGECGQLPIPAAVANAIQDAVGVRVTALPITPERVLDALDRQQPVVSQEGSDSPC